ncbi:sulfite exporter TauE/SafE family protein [Pedobacter immunditicola]|uniref:sulfite exporter TauE/SafE family protein n=1 Tax=Pedobacter immunditicola TaxID=3133440 RepID=UPI003098EF06
MEILAYFASVLIGISLGLIGGGGSILTVPVMVYLFGVNPILATSYSLFIVGTTSLVGAYQNWRDNLVNIKTALLFGLPSILTVFIIRKFFIPFIPAHLFSISGFEVTSNMLTMVLFALLMVAASFSMISEKKAKQQDLPLRSGNILKLLLYGVGIGITTGLLGAGGGFLLIPTLVILLGLPMKEAVGTSLMIIALNSLVGFAGDLGHYQIDWSFLFKVSSIAIAGVFLGTFLSTKIEGGKLKKGFGGFVFVMGGYIILKELFLKP